MRRSGQRFSIFSHCPFYTTLPKRPIASEWFDVLSAANYGNADEVPEGWKTVREIAAETGYSGHHVWKRLRQLHEAGKIERRRSRICTGTTIRPVPHYHPSNTSF